MGNHSVRDQRAKVREYMAEHDVSYTAALRAIEAASKNAGSAYRPHTLLLDPMTGCWRSWGSSSEVTMLAPDVADDGEVLYGPITIGGESFHNNGLLQLRQGEVAATWLRDLGAPVGSKHRDGQECAVCHDFYHYDEPTTLELLEHRAHQAAAAFERRAGLGMGTGATVTAERDGERLIATLHLTDPARDGSRLLAMKWLSDYGWKAVSVDPENAERRVEQGTLTGWHLQSVAADVEYYLRQNR